MKQKLLFTALLFFLPVLQIVITINPLTAIQFDIKFSLASLVVLSVLLIIALLSLCIAVIHWINSGFKWRKLMPCIISLIAICGIYYSIKLVIKIKRRRIKNTLQSIPFLLTRENAELI